MLKLFLQIFEFTYGNHFWGVGGTTNIGQEYKAATKVTKNKRELLILWNDTLISLRLNFQIVTKSF